MALTRRFKLVLSAFSLLGVTAVLAVWLSWSKLERYAAAIHQRNVTQEIRGWGQEYASVTNDASAIAAAELVGYISQYYVPGPGYHGPVEVEAALERQRAQSLQRITDGLQRYTHLEYGTNAQRWAEWAELRKKELGGTTKSEPGSAAN